MVDIPGLIEGAAEGAGLGIRFLKHLQRTRLMLHLIDVLPPDGSDIVSNVKTINGELKAFSDELAARDQWTVFNKLDVMPEAERSEERRVGKGGVSTLRLRCPPQTSKKTNIEKAKT